MKEFNPYFSATVVSQYAVRRVATSGKIKVGLRWVFLHPKHELPRHTPLPSRRGHGKLHNIAGVPHCWNGGGPSSRISVSQCPIKLKAASIGPRFTMMSPENGWLMSRTRNTLA